MKRRYRNKNEQMEICEAWQQSGLSRKEFCEQSGIKINALYRWSMKTKPHQLGANNEASCSAKVKFIPVGNVTSEGNFLEIILPNGITLRAHLSEKVIAVLFGELLK